MMTARAQMPQTDDALLGDGRALADILTMAGPELAPRILRQMLDDLTATGDLLRPAFAAADWTAIRAQSHVLIALAGTIGAMRLHALAIDLNGAAHEQDAAQTAALAPPILAGLDALILILVARIAARLDSPATGERA